VDLDHLRAALDRGDFEVAPVTADASGLRPSIETTLHAVMPHRVVVHLHAVEALAHLVRADGEQSVRDRIGGQLRWAYMGYRKPGPELARAIQAEHPGTVDAIFLASHGLVIGADSVAEAESTLQRITSLLATPIGTRSAPEAGTGLPAVAGYRPVSEPKLHALAASPELLERVQKDWALYPDHVVFLGAEAKMLPEAAAFAGSQAPFVFLPGRGVLAAAHAHAGHLAQLHCYLDVLERQQASATLVSLTSPQVRELISWDAEKHRQAVAPAAR
jgi:rhamnose utilization protein RhaD (predicted bifunctional aldolase and dehydrogenase)